MSEKRLPNIKRAIQKLTLPELLILGRTCQIFYAKLEGEGSADLGESLPIYDNAVRHALSVAFSVPNGAIKPQTKRQIKSPVVKSFLERDTTSANPEVVARDSQPFIGEMIPVSSPAVAIAGVTFTEGAELSKF